MDIEGFVMMLVRISSGLGIWKTLWGKHDNSTARICKQLKIWWEVGAFNTYIERQGHSAVAQHSATSWWVYTVLNFALLLLFCCWWEQMMRMWSLCISWGMAGFTDSCCLTLEHLVNQLGICLYSLWWKTMTVGLVIFKEKVFLVLHLTLQNSIWKLTAGHVTENSLDMTKMPREEISPVEDYRIFPLVWYFFFNCYMYVAN